MHEEEEEEEAVVEVVVEEEEAGQPGDVKEAPRCPTYSAASSPVGPCLLQIEKAR